MRLPRALPFTWLDPNIGSVIHAQALTVAKNPLGSSLVCSAGNVIAGDISKYLFADSVHPTPFGHSLLAKQVSDAMKAKGWL